MTQLPGLAAKGAVICTTLSVIVLVWAVVLFQIRQERREVVGSAIRENVNRTIALEQYVARTLEGADLATAYVADRYAHLLERSAPSPTLPLPLADFAVRAPALREINVINARGDLVASSVASAPPKVNVSDRPLFQLHRSNPSTALRVNPPSRSRFTGSWFLILSRRVNLRDGSFGGTVSVHVRPSEMTNFLENASLGDTEVVSVIGLDGITRARRTGNTLSFGQDLRGKPVMQMQKQDPIGTYLAPSALDGVVRYFSFRPLSRYGVFVTCGVSQEAILRPLRARAGGYRVGAALISLAIFIAAWLVLALAKRRAIRQAEIVAANARLQEAQRLAMLGDWSFDSARQEFLWSGDLCAMYERPRTPDRIALRDLTEFAGPQGADAFGLVLKEMQSRRGRHEYEFAVRLPSGVVSHRRVVAVADLDETGGLIGVHGTDQDITRRKLLESLQEQVGHLARIDGLNAIAATLAHELAQPLAAASNYLAAGTMRLARDSALEKIAAVEALNSARGQIVHAGEIIRRVRNLVQDRQARVETISVREVIGCAVTLAEAAKPGSVVKVFPDPDTRPANALADPVQVQQVLVNLIRNARDACRGREPVITIETNCRDAKFVDVCVIDDGPGIPDDGRDVFSPFTPSAGKGLGVGLAICRTLVQSMGGTIWVAQTGETGTTICFTLLQAKGAG
ncbi:ATP-binding protein [Sphingomonas sp. M1-B02]|uniref:ATP-binding protein n=1 Tax=Sphingomonas sp. M1-B02 TaxID=3114300 RepID=UPI00223F0168|nr:ATP-binding protein [Sphingomonas sp. S6-11]UZK66701.1 ATP-binding protein [Sphingomonas sp. S6-11]